MPGVRSDRPRRPRARPRPVRVNRERGTTGEGDERRRRESNPLLRFCRPPPGRQAPAPSLLRPSPEGHVLARNRTWSPTFAKSCARPSHPEDIHRNRPAAESPTRESNPALRLRRPPCVRHTREETTQCPCQESNLVFDLRGVACRPSHAKGSIEADGRTRTGMNLLTRQGPHRSATSAAAGAQGFEPCPRGLEARCSPRSTPLKRAPAWLEAGALVSITQGAGPARAAGTGPSSRFERPAPHTAASTRGGPAGAGAS